MSRKKLIHCPRVNKIYYKNKFRSLSSFPKHTKKALCSMVKVFGRKHIWVNNGHFHYNDGLFIDEDYYLLTNLWSINR